MQRDLGDREGSEDGGSATNGQRLTLYSAARLCVSSAGVELPLSC